MAKNYKRIKVERVYIKDTEDREIVSTKEKTKGNKYYVTNASIKVADDCPSGYAGKWLKVGFFAYKDKTDSKKDKSGFSKAEYFKSQNEGKEIIVEIESEVPYVTKDGVEGIDTKVQLLSKKEEETVSQFI